MNRHLAALEAARNALKAATNARDAAHNAPKAVTNAREGAHDVYGFVDVGDNTGDDAFDADHQAAIDAWLDPDSAVGKALSAAAEALNSAASALGALGAHAAYAAFKAAKRTASALNSAVN